MRHFFISAALFVEVLHAANLFPYETIQLQTSDLQSLPTEYSPHFVFSTQSPSKNSTCKVFPGDAAWPDNASWAVLNSTTTYNGLIKTIPLAAPCYNYPGIVYDAEKCTAITDQWTNSSLQ